MMADNRISDVQIIYFWSYPDDCTVSIIFILKVPHSSSSRKAEEGVDVSPSTNDDLQASLEYSEELSSEPAKDSDDSSI